MRSESYTPIAQALHLKIESIIIARVSTRPTMLAIAPKHMHACMNE